MSKEIPNNLNWESELFDSVEGGGEKKQVVYDCLHRRIRDKNANDHINEEITRKVCIQLGVDFVHPIFIEGAILDWIQLSETMEIEYTQAVAGIEVNDETLGVHYRRGDKAVESSYVPAEVINKEIEDLCKKYKFKSIFLASDSASAPTEIRVPAGVKLIFDTTEKRYNNANHKMLFAKPDLAWQETVVAIKNIYLLKSCGGIVGQSNAHFAIIASAAIAIRTNDIARACLIDGWIAEKLSYRIKILSNIKYSIRYVARRVLPWLTIAGRAKSMQINREKK